MIALRRCVLAVCVLDDVDLLPRDDGVVLPGPPAVHVPWALLADALGDAPAESGAGRARVRAALRLHQLAARHGTGTPNAVRGAARAVALPPGHHLHPGPAWVRERLPGGVLDLGLGLLGLSDQPDDVRPLPPGSAAALGLDADGWWPAIRDHAERMGGLTARRIARDGRPVLRPHGGCDALTLLASAALRAALADGDGTGLRAVAAPTRRRAWFDLRQADPEFVAAAWSLTSPQDRGLPRPLLVTRHEVALPHVGTSPEPPGPRHPSR